jgi:hypothetical protein
LPCEKLELVWAFNECVAEGKGKKQTMTSQTHYPVHPTHELTQWCSDKCNETQNLLRRN